MEGVEVVYFLPLLVGGCFFGFRLPYSLGSLFRINHQNGTLVKAVLNFYLFLYHAFMKSIALVRAYRYTHHYIYTGALAVGLFSAYYAVMARLPSTDGYACIVGAGLNAGNLFFSAVLSLMTAVMAFGLFRLYQKRKPRRRDLAAGSTLWLGFLLGFFTVFCAVCTLPVISVFGLAVGLGFFTTFNVLFKAVSLSMMAFSLWLINRQLGECGCST